MAKYETKFRLGEMVKTMLGTVGVIDSIKIYTSLVLYFVSKENGGSWWTENQLKPLEPDATE